MIYISYPHYMVYPVDSFPPAGAFAPFSQLTAKQPLFIHLPGQWLDVHIPNVDEIGGFTITSPPSTSYLAPLNRKPFLELAIQRSPQNPPAAFFWRSLSEINGTELRVRIGGNFTWPPPKLSESEVSSPNLTRAVFVAGDVGINPLISMLSHLSEKGKWPPVVQLFYSVRLPQLANKTSRTLNSILFFTRLNAIVRDARTWNVNFKFRLIVTGVPSDHKPLQLAADNDALDLNGRRQDSNGDRDGEDPTFWTSAADTSYGERLKWAEIQGAIGNEGERKGAVVYICGPQQMTDEIIEGLKEKEGMRDDRVYCEKWW